MRKSCLKFPYFCRMESQVGLEAELIYTTEKQLWKLLLDPSSATLLVECRHQEGQAMDYVSLALRSEEINAEWLNIEGFWWTNSQAISKDFLVFSRFSPDSPQSQSCGALDLETGKVMWEREQLSFLDNNPDQLLATEISTLNHICLSMATGEPTEQAWQAEASSSLLPPEEYTEESQLSDSCTLFRYTFRNSSKLDH